MWKICGALVQSLQRPDAADAEQDLLAQPVLCAAAVKAVGDGPQVVGVFVDVGVEQVELYPPTYATQSWAIRA